MSEDELAHSLRGPSGAHRWRRCHGSINAERGRPEKVGREAAEGSVFHMIAALCLMFDLEPEHFPEKTYKQDGYDIVFDDDMRHYMHAGLDWVRDQLEPDDILFVETRVDISPWCGEGEFGTCDVCILKVRKRTKIIFDWKYGKGIPVSPVKNDQCYNYGLGCWHTFAEDYFAGVDPKDIEVVFNVEQPRASGGGGIWRTTMEEVLAEGILIREDALATMDPNAARTPGEKQCMFCKASGDCAEQDAYMLMVARQKFDDIEVAIELGTAPILPAPASLNAEARSFILLNWKTLTRWKDKIHALTLHDLSAGKPVPLIKAVAGKPGHRRYHEDQLPMATKKLVALVGEDKALVTKLISPAEAEKLIGKPKWRAEMAEFVGQSTGKPILVPIEDKRPPLQDFASKFDDLDEDDDDETGED